MWQLHDSQILTLIIKTLLGENPECTVHLMDDFKVGITAGLIQYYDVSCLKVVQELLQPNRRFIIYHCV